MANRIDIPFLSKKNTRQAVQPGLQAGLTNLSGLLQNPGGLSPNVSQAIQPRLAIQSEGIARNFANLRQNQAGAAARGNLPVSIKAALEAALGMGEAREQRNAEREALSDSEALRRQDISQIFQLVNMLLNKPQEQQGMPNPNAAAGIGAIGQIISAFASK